MTHGGFTDVDRSDNAAQLVDYLARLSRRLAAMRKEDYGLLQLRPGAALLDVGCGAGEVCVELAIQVGEAGRVAGVDPSQAMIAAAREAAAASAVPIDLHVGSVYSLPFAADSFDAVRAERVFQHLHDPEAALAEMIRVARPGGRIVVIDPDHGQGGMALDAPEDRRVFEASVRAQSRLLVNSHSGSRLKAMFVRAGLKDITQVVRAVEVTSYAEFAQLLMLPDRLRAAVESGEIGERDAERFTAELERRDREQTFFANAIAYSVAGTKP